MSEISLKQVSKTYPNGYNAIKNANIEIKSGEFTVFVGPSGCGKSTLLRMVAGLENISEGEIIIGERKVNDLEPAKRDIAMVFQNYALYPHMSVYKNLAYGLMNRKIPKDEIDKRVKATAKMLQIDEYLDRKPSQLSGGQRQRIAMGRAIVRKPKAFLFDEPLSNLDAKLRTRMRLEIKTLQKNLNITSIYVTHDQVEAMTMADKIVVLNKGQIEQIGTPKEIYHQPQSLFVATFIGSPPMNIFNAQYADENLRFSDGITLPFKPDADFTNTNIKVGFRPESIELSDSTDNSLPIRIEVIEELGAQRLVHAKLGEQELVWMTQHSDIQEQQTVNIKVQTENLYFFDAQTGKRV